MATGDAGPLRHRYGSPRDLDHRRVTVALSDGTIAQAGGKVIKNVAGYDLAKLLVSGAFGTLGLILVGQRAAAPAAAETSVDRARGRLRSWAVLGAAAVALARAPLEFEASWTWPGRPGAADELARAPAGRRRGAQERRGASHARRRPDRGGRHRPGRPALGAPARLGQRLSRPGAGPGGCVADRAGGRPARRRRGRWHARRPGRPGRELSWRSRPTPSVDCGRRCREPPRARCCSTRRRRCAPRESRGARTRARARAMRRVKGAL